MEHLPPFLSSFITVRTSLRYDTIVIVHQLQPKYRPLQWTPEGDCSVQLQWDLQEHSGNQEYFYILSIVLSKNHDSCRPSSVSNAQSCCLTPWCSFWAYWIEKVTWFDLPSWLWLATFSFMPKALLKKLRITTIILKILLHQSLLLILLKTKTRIIPWPWRLAINYSIS